MAPPAGLEHHHVHDDRRHHLGPPPRPAGAGGRRGQPRLHWQLLVPDRRRGRLRAVARRRGPGDQLVLGQRGRRRLTVAQRIATPIRLPRPSRMVPTRGRSGLLPGRWTLQWFEYEFYSYLMSSLALNRLLVTPSIP